ncbi:hypothetical protein [Micromonospora aurantiaca (nom. illeg.)]|uniref:hypothetical protein n=1 Tax=Micromonospora aurantiaca (nom. illeg.) TaxID=47850 RepID=UPI00379C4AC3
MTDSDVPPPPRADRRAAALAAFRDRAREFYDRDPLVEDGFSRILDRDTYWLDAGDVSDLLGPCFEERHRLAYDDEGRRVVVRVRRDDPAVADAVPRHELTARVCRLLAELPDPPRGPSRRGLREAVESIRELARLATPRPPRNGQGRPRGARVRWVADVVSNILDSLDDFPDFRGDVARPNWRATRTTKPKPTAAPKPDPAAIEETARAFVAALAPGRHPVPEVWTAYTDATPPTERLGKHAFNALARDVLGEPRKIRGVRLWTVPEPAVIAEVAERVARLAWEEQRAILLRIVRREPLAAAAVEEARAA